MHTTFGGFMKLALPLLTYKLQVENWIIRRHVKTNIKMCCLILLLLPFRQQRT